MLYDSLAVGVIQPWSYVWDKYDKYSVKWAIIIRKGYGTYAIIFVLLPRGRIQEIKRMTLVNFTHGLFLTCTQKSHYIYKSCNIYTMYNIPTRPSPLYWIRQPRFTYLENQLLCLWWQYPSTLVSGLPTTGPSFALPLSPFHTPQFKLLYLHRRHQQFSVVFVQDNIKGTIAFVFSILF
jgi:hypothetical protein